MGSEINYEKTVMAALSDNQRYAPLEITFIPLQSKTSKNVKDKSADLKKTVDRFIDKIQPDALIRVKWQDREFSFIAEIKSRSAPQIAQQAIWQLKSFAEKNDNQILVVPYLSKTIAEMVTKEKISALDLNGNYLIQAKDLLAIRLDKENRYKESKTIKKIYSGNSSLVGRLLLKEPRIFNSLDQIYQAISNLGGAITLSTISKVLKSLEEELIIQKEMVIKLSKSETVMSKLMNSVIESGPKKIRLIQPAKLLEKLKNEYSPPKIQETLKLNVPDPLMLLSSDLPNKSWVLTGESSASRYTITTPPKALSAYVTEFKNWNQYVDERFFNLVLRKTEDKFVYFDAQKENYSSKLQCYLELSRLDKREKEIAQSIQEDILGAFQ